MRLGRLVQFVSDQSEIYMKSDVLFNSNFLSVRDFYFWNKHFLDHKSIKMIFPYSGILYFVMNYRIKGTIKL